jgi:hypothetical protein
MWYGIIILVVLIILYIVSIDLNRRVKAPEGVKLPDQCMACHSATCMVKTDAEKVKQEMLEEIRKQEKCDEGH